MPYPRDDIVYEALESSNLDLVCGFMINGSCWYDGVNAELAIVGDNDVFENHAITLGMPNLKVHSIGGTTLDRVISALVDPHWSASSGFWFDHIGLQHFHMILHVKCCSLMWSNRISDAAL